MIRKLRTRNPLLTSKAVKEASHPKEGKRPAGDMESDAKKDRKEEQKKESRKSSAYHIARRVALEEGKTVQQAKEAAKKA